MAKRKGFILEEIADMENLRAADADAQKGKKANRAIRRHNEHVEEDLLELRRMILTLDFPKPDYRIMIKTEADKRRKIAAQHYFPWQIFYHAIMRVIGDDILSSLIYDTSACIKGRGILFGVKRTKMFLRRYPQFKWFAKADYRKFYQSTPYDSIMRAFRRKYKDERFLKLIELTILNYNDEEIDNLLEDEIRKKRHSSWSIYKSTDRKLRRKCDRSQVQGTIQSKVPT